MQITPKGNYNTKALFLHINTPLCYIGAFILASHDKNKIECSSDREGKTQSSRSSAKLYVWPIIAYIESLPQQFNIRKM